MEKVNIFISFLEKIFKMPLWVKSALFLELKTNINKYLNDNEMAEVIDKDELYQCQVLTLTYSGKKELSSRAGRHNPHLYRFLEGVSSGLSIMEITLNNYWSLEETAMANMDCIDSEYVTPPISTRAKSTLLYFANRIRIGEYLKRIGKINVDQLDLAIRKQKELSVAGQKVGIASLMINLGYIKEEDSNFILFLKDESKRRFILNPEEIIKNELGNTPQLKEPVSEGNTNRSKEDEALIAKLSNENAEFRKKLQAISQILSIG